MGKVDIKKQIKKDALLQAAFDLFTNEETSRASISEIAKHAGVAKGTFYLYFKDKYDIRNRLIQKKVSQIFTRAGEALMQTDLITFEDQIIFLVDNIIDQLSEDKRLMYFISKNLSWGIFKNALMDGDGELDENFTHLYDELITAAGKSYTSPDVLMYMIMELVNGSTYGSILFNDPVPIEELKPYLYNTIRLIIRGNLTEEKI